MGHNGPAPAQKGYNRFSIQEELTRMNSSKMLLVSGIALLLMLGGCSKKTEDEGTETKEATSSAPATPVDMSTVGDVSGKVILNGTPPPLKAINMSAEPYCSKTHPTAVTPQDVVAGSGGTLQNVVVYVKDGLGDRSFDVPKDAAVLQQKGCMYEPHIVALMAGQTLQVVNADQTTHNIHPIPKDNREWNKSQPPGATPIEDTFPRAEVSIPVKCNVHPWMKSYIAVLKNPYFVVTAADGSFDLKNLPPGTYTIEAWQEKYGTMDQQVTVGPKESKTVNFTFNAAAPAGD
jgi:plastocyanin